jgi:hypothetical protein
VLPQLACLVHTRWGLAELRKCQFWACFADGGRLCQVLQQHWEAFHGCITEESHVAVGGAMQCMHCRPWHVLPDESRETPLSLAA